jgi:hypothetical protein
MREKKSRSRTPQNSIRLDNLELPRVYVEAAHAAPNLSKAAACTLKITAAAARAFLFDFRKSRNGFSASPVSTESQNAARHSAERLAASLFLVSTFCHDPYPFRQGFRNNKKRVNKIAAREFFFLWQEESLLRCSK